MSVPVILVPSTPPVEPIAARLKEVRLQRDDFEILKVIGRGAFSEVSLEQSNYCPVALISHASKVMLKILQVRLQHHCESYTL